MTTADADVSALEQSYWPADREPILTRLEKRAKGKGGLPAEVRAQLVRILPKFTGNNLRGKTEGKQLERAVRLVGADGWETAVAGWRARLEDKKKTAREIALGALHRIARSAPRSVVTPSLWDALLHGWAKVGDRDGAVADAVALAPNFEELIRRRVKTPPGGWPRVMHALADASRAGVDVGFAIKELESAAARGDVHAARAALAQHLRAGNVAAARKLLKATGKLAVDSAVAHLVTAALPDAPAVVAFLPAALGHENPQVAYHASAACVRLAIFGVDLSPVLPALENILTDAEQDPVQASNALGWMMTTKAGQSAEAVLKKHLRGSDRTVVNAAAGLALGHVYRGDLKKVDELLKAAEVPVREGCALGLMSAGRQWAYLSLDRGKDGRRPPQLRGKKDVDRRLQTLKRDPSPRLQKLFR